MIAINDPEEPEEIDELDEQEALTDKQVEEIFYHQQDEYEQGETDDEEISA